MNKTLLNALLVFIAGSSYGFLVPVVKIALDFGIHPTDFLPLQYALALVMCLMAMAVKRVRFSGPKKLASMALLGLCTGGCSICYYTAVSLLPGAVALTLLFQYVWVGLVIECISKRKLPNGVGVVSVIIVMVGTLLAAGVFDGSFEALDPVGIGFGAFSALFYALFLYFSGVVCTEQPMLLRTTMLAFGGLVITSIAGPASYTLIFTQPMIWPFALVLCITGILLPTALINYASPKLPASMVSIMASSELPIGILSGWILVNDTPTPLVLTGAVLVLVGIVVKQLPELLKKRT